MSFKRVIEDFVCEHCGTLVEGDGYTNHCPKCLWSLHVDNDPGDRQNGCGGLMEPVGLDYKSSGSTIMHKCTKCGVIKRNKAAQGDDTKVLLEVMKS